MVVGIILGSINTSKFCGIREDYTTLFLFSILSLILSRDFFLLVRSLSGFHLRTDSELYSKTS